MSDPAPDQPFNPQRLAHCCSQARCTYAKLLTTGRGTDSRLHAFQGERAFRCGLFTRPLPTRFCETTAARAWPCAATKRLPPPTLTAWLLVMACVRSGDTGGISELCCCGGSVGEGSPAVAGVMPPPMLLPSYSSADRAAWLAPAASPVSRPLPCLPFALTAPPGRRSPRP